MAASLETKFLPFPASTLAQKLHSAHWELRDFKSGGGGEGREREAWNPLWKAKTRVVEAVFFQVPSASRQKVLQKPHCWGGKLWLSQTPIPSFLKVWICLKFLWGESYNPRGQKTIPSRGRRSIWRCFFPGIKGGTRSEAMITVEPWGEGRTWNKVPESPHKVR